MTTARQGRARNATPADLGLKRVDGILVSATGRDRGTEEARRHGEFVLEGTGEEHARKLSAFERMRSRGVITADQLVAAERFADDYTAARFDACAIASYEGRLDRGGPGSGEATLEARNRVHLAKQALGGAGSPAAVAVERCAGWGESIAVYAAKEGWNGRALRHETATGILIGALAVLVEFYRRIDRHGISAA